MNASPQRFDLGAFVRGEGMRMWWPVLVGMLVMFVPTFYDMFTGIWSTEEQAHGPIIFCVALWLIYRNWGEMMTATEGQSGSRAGWFVVIFGAIFYVLGRTQEIQIIEMGSFLWMLAGSALLVRGGRALRVQWFPLFFMLFMLPLPGPLVDAVTMPMKMAVSYVAEHVLYQVGYPIARTGVILQIGQYQLLVADACAGLHTLFTLEALGLLYLNIVRHTSFFRNVMLAIFIVPISFTANVIRVMTLTLVTYHLGDAAGQGFLHGFAGMVLFISALTLIVAADTLLRIGGRERKTPTAA